MKINQIYDIVNGISKEILGEQAVVAENLENIVDIGKEIFDNTSYDKYVKTLVDHIGRVIFVDRAYEGTASELYRDSWEYGAVMEKITGDLPEAVENESWNLTDKASYDPNVFNKPDVSAKFFDKRTTFEIDLSIADKQARSAFNSANQMNSFLTMLTGNVDKSLTVKMDSLAERTVNNFILQTLDAEFPNVIDNDYSNSTGVKAINLLKVYNTTFSKSLTAAACLYDEDFLKFASMIIRRTVIRMKKMSKLFNVGGKARFTPSSLQHVILHGDFTTAADMYLQSGTFHKELVELPKFREVAYFQGSGTDYSFSSTSNISGIIEKGSTTKTISLDGVIGVVFDHDAMGITNLDRRVTSNYNPKAEFTNYFYKVDCGYFNDLNESGVVFFVQ